MLTNSGLTFSTYLKINTNLAATTMNPANTDPFGTNNLFDSFTTAHQDGLLSESEDDDYQGNDKYNEEKEDELGEIIANELSSLARQYTVKHNRGKKVPSLKTTGYVLPPPSPYYNGLYLPTESKKEPPKQQKFKTIARKVKPRIVLTATVS